MDKSFKLDPLLTLNVVERFVEDACRECRSFSEAAQLPRRGLEKFE